MAPLGMRNFVNAPIEGIVDRSFQNSYMAVMARHKEFDRDEALDRAIGVFREHGFEGSSSTMLVEAMKIGRQSLYDTFGDKWGLYVEAVGRYSAGELEAHRERLRSGPRAIDGLRAMLERVAAQAHLACLGVNSVCEFGRRHDDLNKAREAAEAVLQQAIVARVRDAQAEGDVAADLDPQAAAGFLQTNLAGLRIAARGGASADQLKILTAYALRALR